MLGFEGSKLKNSNKVVDALLGVAVGDALGVPYEFKTRGEMKLKPIKTMQGFGSHFQPKGTWSDDSSLTFCLAESLVEGYSLKDMSLKFIAWRDNSYWTARNKVFDIGRTTYDAISRLKGILEKNDLELLKNQKNNAIEIDNGNGSLMRIIPLVFYIRGKEVKEQFNIVWEVSSLTHRHIRAAMSCLIYLKLIEFLLEGLEKELAYEKMQTSILLLWEKIDFPKKEREFFKNIISNHILLLKEEELKTGGYVIEVLESSIWFFMKKNNYKNTVLSIINLGHDTDTSAAIAGGLAGVYYGARNIPKSWINDLARREDIIDLGNRLSKSLNT